eukprot:scaffold198_cov352-Prasinococcus_capsulatus_cf.AAC.8
MCVASPAGRPRAGLPGDACLRPAATCLRPRAEPPPSARAWAAGCLPRPLCRSAVARCDWSTTGVADPWRARGQRVRARARRRATLCGTRSLPARQTTGRACKLPGWQPLPNKHAGGADRPVLCSTVAMHAAHGRRQLGPLPLARLPRLFLGFLCGNGLALLACDKCGCLPLSCGPCRSLQLT